MHLTSTRLVQAWVCKSRLCFGFLLVEVAFPSTSTCRMIFVARGNDCNFFTRVLRLTPLRASIFTQNSAPTPWRSLTLLCCIDSLLLGSWVGVLGTFSGRASDSERVVEMSVRLIPVWSFSLSGSRAFPADAIVAPKVYSWVVRGVVRGVVRVRGG